MDLKHEPLIIQIVHLHQTAGNFTEAVPSYQASEKLNIIPEYH